MSSEKSRGTHVVDPSDEFRVEPLLECLRPGGPPAPGLTMPLVTAWPVDSNQWKDSYEKFLQAFKSCWECESDWARTVSHPALYLYPQSHLHVTIATCFRDVTRTIPAEERMILVQKWQTVLQHATTLPDWPQEPLQLTLESAQVGTAACILLWRDTSGGIRSVRNCLRQAVRELPHLMVQLHDIPDIIHTTFCRFNDTPSSRRAVVQERLATQVLPRLAEFLPRPLVASTCKLVSELRPYMHIPHDADHLHATAWFRASGVRFSGELVEPNV